MRYYVENFGCRATQADGAALEAELSARGYGRAPVLSQAELVIVNTCTVTSTADQQARQYIRGVHRKNPGARILVTGCYAQRAPQDLARLPGVRWVVGNSHKPQIPGLVEHASPSPSKNFVPIAGLSPTPAEERDWSLATGPAKILTGDILEQSQVLVAPVFGAGTSRTGTGDRTRPTLKIQDGCNSRCAYCVIPFVRGRSRSLPPEQVLEQVKRLNAAGSQEVVLSGIDLGSYGRDLRTRTTLLELLERLLAETSLPLLRLSSLEPLDLTEAFLALLASSRRIARHIHAPLQSGSNPILRRMHRWYTREEYAERVQAATDCLPNLGLGADVIVGFPGETEADFRRTYELVEQLPFTYLHVFSFSSRPGTAAANLPERVPPAAIKERQRALRALAARKSESFYRRQLGGTLRVLTLNSTAADGARLALSENYLKVRLPAEVPANRLLSVGVVGLEAEGLQGQPAGLLPAWIDPRRQTA